MTQGIDYYSDLKRRNPLTKYYMGKWEVEELTLSEVSQSQNYKYYIRYLNLIISLKEYKMVVTGLQKKENGLLMDVVSFPQC